MSVPQGTPAQMQTAKRYQDSRMAERHDETMSYVSDTIKFHSQRDGDFTGKAQFREYLTRTKIEGHWGDPEIDPKTGLVIILGKIKFLGIPVKVKGTFKFNAQGQIQELTVAKA
eukprot:NODE_2463_length_599_cov_1264.240000_g2096_i0.p2 GENE.NODE_2463_length_599_cov_1264.240000_g2096_i0~~NODE_2463_length_599_cov_1264.240000_g2096_i0.p2  ORF type:complete len:114 (-),score=18.04 NODE_2463_length_599_cov_1264.240000_g2096_i0:162-503(-)